MDDLDESLPSRSTFAYTEQTHRSYSGSRGFGASHAVIDEEDEYLYYDRRSFDETHRVMRPLSIALLFFSPLFSQSLVGSFLPCFFSLAPFAFAAC